MPTLSREPLPISDTNDRFGLISRILHWGMAALLLWQLLGLVLKQVLGKTPFVHFFTGSHQWLGALLFVLIVLRVVWSFVNRHHRPAHGDGLMGLAARAGHMALYAVMLIVPGAALLRAYGNDRVFSLFGFQVFPAQQPEIGWMVGIGDALHGELGWLMLALIVGHVVMVGLHQAMWHDGTLQRMVGRDRG